MTIKTQPKPKSRPEPEEPEAPLGWAKLVREGGGLIEQVSKTKEELAFSTSRVPQIRMRAASEHTDEVAYIDEKYRIDFKDWKANTAQYRTVIMLEQALQLRSGKHLVLLDRHPDCPHEIIDAFQAHVRKRVRSTVQKVTRRHARSAAVTSERIWEFLQDSTVQNEAYRMTMTALLERVLERGSLTEEDRKLLNRLRFSEGANAALTATRRRTANDLDRTEVD